MARSSPVAGLIISALAAALGGCSPVPMPPSAEPSQAGLVATPTAAPATPARSTVAPSPTTVLAPLPSGPMPMAVREAMTAPGAIVVADIEQGPSPWWVLTVHVVREGRPVVSGSIGIQGDGWTPLGNDHPGHADPFDILTGTVQLTRDGWAAIAVNAATGHISTVVVDAFGERNPSPVIRGWEPIWLPDGTLLVFGSLARDAPHEEGFRRVTEHGFGKTFETVVPTDGAELLHPLRYIVHGDLSGIQAREAGPEPWGTVTVRWDGTLGSRKRKDPPYLALGAERTAGARGEAVVGSCGWGPCALKWQRPGGRKLAHPAIDLEHAWTRDGTALVVLDGNTPDIQEDNLVLLIRDSDSGLVTTTLGQPRPEELMGGLFFFTGMSDWAVALERDQDNHVNVIPLDGSPAIGPLVGTVALVNP